MENRYSQEDEENDSIWWFNDLDFRGANNDFRKICQDSAITMEIICTFAKEYSVSVYNVGSRSEGTFDRDGGSDQDIIHCDDTYPVIEDILEADEDQIYLLIVRDSATSAGYVKLQLVMRNIPCTVKNWHMLSGGMRCLKPDRFGQIVLFDFIQETLHSLPFISSPKNKPAAKVIKDYYNIDADTVLCYRCKKWPNAANEWLSRHRSNGWPTQKTIDELKSFGFFVVKKCHPLSSEIDLEWRISLSLQERKLIFDLTDIQYKCYFALKMINRDFLKLDCITTYHWKTCLFYVIEENETIIWEKKRLHHSVKLCVNKMLEWVKDGCCPNYFIPSENMFEVSMNPDSRRNSENKLEKLLTCLNDGSYLKVPGKSNNVQGHIISRENAAERIKVNRNAVFTYIMNSETTRLVMGGVSFILFEYTENKKDSNVINSLWRTLDQIKNVNSLCDHTIQETRRALSLLKPFFYTCLASNISAKCIQLPNPSVRDFLLFGCYTFFLKGGIHGRLKFITVLYAAGCYKDCEWYLDQEDEEYIKNNPSICACYGIHNSMANQMGNDTTEIAHFKMSTCILFLPTELQIIPDALKFEIFKYIGIPTYESDRDNFLWRWHYWAVVDSNIYFFVLKFLIYRKVKQIKLSLDVLDCIQNLMSGSNVVHRDVANNLMAWCYCSVGLVHTGLNKLRMSWQMIYPPNSLFLYFNKELIQKHYQFNSAKVHAMVILFNIWFSRKPRFFQFCFQCLVPSEDALQKCSRCKTATYCTKKCQKMHWRIHKAVCKIVRMYHNI